MRLSFGIRDSFSDNAVVAHQSSCVPSAHAPARYPSIHVARHLLPQHGIHPRPVSTPQRNSARLLPPRQTQQPARGPAPQRAVGQAVPWPRARRCPARRRSSSTERPRGLGRRAQHADGAARAWQRPGLQVGERHGRLPRAELVAREAEAQAQDLCLLGHG